MGNLQDLSKPLLKMGTRFTAFLSPSHSQVVYNDDFNCFIITERPHWTQKGKKETFEEMRRKHYAGMGKLAMEKHDPFVEEYLKRAEKVLKEKKIDTKGAQKASKPAQKSSKPAQKASKPAQKASKPAKKDS